MIGKRFQDAGLRDVCVESGVIADGSAAGVLEGRSYNRAIRFHKLDKKLRVDDLMKGLKQLHRSLRTS